MRAPIRAILLAGLLAAASSDLAAAVRYTVWFHGEQASAERKGFEVVVDDDRRIRATSAGRVDDPVIYDGLIASSDGGIVALNSTNRTWYVLRRPPFTPSAMSVAAGPKATVKVVEAKFDDAGADAGSHRYSGRVVYEVVWSVTGARVKVFCSATYEIVTAESLDRRFWPGKVLPVTGLPRVDQLLNDVDARVSGFPTRISLTTTRRYEGGPEMRQTAVVETTTPETTAVDPSVFAIPAGYIEQEPVLGVPGT